MFWNCINIMFWKISDQNVRNCNYILKKTQLASSLLMKRSLNRKITFKIQGYDTIPNDRSTGRRGGVAFLVKHGLVVNKEFRNADFNIITENEALAINLELSCNQDLTLATIYCPNGTPNFSLFRPSQTFPTMSCLLEISTRS